MIRARNGSIRRRPRHARPSLLAPTRSLALMTGVAAVVGLAVAGCAAVAGHPSDAGGVARPAAVRAPAAGFDGSRQAAGGAALLGAADIAAMRRSGSGGAALAAAAPGSAAGAAGGVDAAPASGLAASGIPDTALAAYKNAAAREAARTPACGLSWPLLAGIGRVESNHGRFAGAVLHSDGLSTPRIIGIPLNGNGTAVIRDTDGGRLDGDTSYDRAVGPMQFIPSTWAGWGVDADHNGVRDPFNIFDAAAAAADYLCAAGRDLTTAHGQVQAILSYNYSYDYVSLVMGLEKIYASGVGVSVPVLPTSAEPGHGRPAQRPPLPPVDPGKPRGASVPPPPRSTPGGHSAGPSSIAPSPGKSSSSSSGASSSPGSGGSSSSSSGSSSPAPPTSPSPSCSPTPSDATSASAATTPSGTAPPSCSTSTDATSPSGASTTPAAPALDPGGS
jgi:membrane-bound lytic murein transglycosylase B